MNDFLEAAKDDENQESSSQRYQNLKKQEACNDETEAEKRYRELKEQAKEEFIERQKKRKKEQEQEEEEEDSSDSESFVTY